MWALLALYQALRAVMVEAAESVPGTDPDRCCFTVAVQTARDQVVQAAGIVPAESHSLGLIGRRVLARLLSPRRHRTSTRKVKSPMSLLEPGPDQRPCPWPPATTAIPPQPGADGTASSPRCRTTRPAYMETRGDHRPLRRHHPAHHVSPAVPMSRQRPHPQARAATAWSSTALPPGEIHYPASLGRSPPRPLSRPDHAATCHTGPVRRVCPATGSVAHSVVTERCHLHHG
jgi:hypothetical protein